MEIIFKRRAVARARARHRSRHFLLFRIRSPVVSLVRDHDQHVSPKGNRTRKGLGFKITQEMGWGLKSHKKRVGV